MTQASPVIAAFLIPVFNNQEGLIRSLESLNNMAWPGKPLTVVVDDGSPLPLTIDTKVFADIGLQLVRLPCNMGIEAALNAGLRALEAHKPSYIARLDAGDTVAPERLLKQLALLEAHPKRVLVGSSVRMLNADGTEAFRQEPPPDDAGIRRRMFLSTALLHPSVILRADALQAVGGYRTDYPAAEDYDLFFRLLKVGEAASVPACLTTCTLSSGGISARRRRRQLHSRLRLQVRHFNVMALASPVGLLLTLALLLMPDKLVATIKRRLGKVPV